MSKQDLYQAAREKWDDCVEAAHKQRERMVEDLKFSNPSDPQQWDDAISRARQTDPGGARPTYVFDQTNQYIAQVVNDFRMNKPQIQTVPASSGADEKVSDALNGLIRQIEYASSASIAYDTALEHAARIGMGWIRIMPKVIDPQYNEQEIRICRVHDPLAVRYDPNFTMPDGSDQTCGFIETTITKAEYLKKYRKKRVSGWKTDKEGWFDDDSVRICEFFEQVEEGESNLLIEDPDNGHIIDNRTSVLESEYWDIHKKTGVRLKTRGQYETKKKRVRWYKMDGDDFLEEGTDFPSQHIPLVPVMGYETWIDGKRYVCGMVRRMMAGQRAYNMERNTELEWMASQPKAPYIVAWESVSEHQKEWGSANISHRAYLPYDHKDEEGNPIPPPRREAPPNPGAAFQNLGQKGLADLQASIGMYRANLGAPSNETSGIAIKRREQQGDTANFHYTDDAARSLAQVGRIILDMLPRLYDEKREARILGLDGKSQPVMIRNDDGKPVTMKGKTVESINLNSGTYDVRCKVGPAYASLREEAADSLTKIVQSSPQLMTVLGPMWARMQDWPEAEKISKLLLALAPPQVQALEDSDEEIPPQLMAQMQQKDQQIQQMQMQMKQLQDALVNASEQHTMTEAQVKNIETDNQIDWFKAQTDRLKVEGTLMTPEQVQAIATQTAMQTLQASAPPAEAAPDPVMQSMAAMMAQMQEHSAHLGNLTAVMAAPKQIVRDEAGKAVGVQPVLSNG